MSPDPIKVIPLAFLGDDDVLGPEERRRLNLLESLVVSVLHADIAGGSDYQTVGEHRSNLLDARARVISAAGEWERPKRFGWRPRSRQTAEVMALLEGSERWRQRARLTLEASAFDTAERLAEEAIGVAKGDAGLRASASLHIALAKQWRAESLPDLLTLQSAHLAALGAANEVVKVVGVGASGRNLRVACSALATLCLSVVHGAERILSDRALEVAGEYVDGTAPTFADAELAITSPPSVDKSDREAVALAVTFGLIRSRLSEVRHVLAAAGSTLHLDEAMALSGACFDLASEGGDPDGVARSAAVFARQFFQRYHDGARPEASEAFATVLQHGLLWSMPGSVASIRLLTDWGEILFAHSEHQGRHDAGLLAAVIYTTCCEELQRRDPEACADVARRWARIVGGRDDSSFALEAYEHGLRAVRRLTNDHAIESHRIIVNVNAGRLYGEAAACYAGAGRTARAAEVAEAGRSITVQPIVTAPTAELQSVRDGGHAALAVEYLSAVEEERETLARERIWDAPEAPGPRDAFAAATDRIAASVARRRRVEAAIRALPGQDDFPRGVTYEDIRDAATDAPLAYIVPGRVSGSIILVRDATVDEPERIPLPLLTDHDLGPRALEYLTAYREWQPEQRVEGAWTELLDSGGRWLWDAAVGPLLDAVGDTFVRVLPMGLLMALPLQTAWSTSNGRRTYAIDRATISQLPSAAALRYCRTREPAPEWRAALVDDPEGDFAGSREIKAAAQRFADDPIWLDGDRATPAAVVEALTRANVAHISAHGFVNESNPRRSAIVLAGGAELTLDELRRVPDANLELLVLSSCESALGGGKSLDQGLSFPGLMYGVAANAVIAAQWAVDVDATSRVFESFYRCWDLAHAPRATAEALRRAQIEARDSGPDHPVWWAGFVHVG